MLSPETGFTNGTACNLKEDVPEEIVKLDADAYEYDSDSDLEGAEDGVSTSKGKEKASTPVESISTSTPYVFIACYSWFSRK